MIIFYTAAGRTQLFDARPVTPSEHATYLYGDQFQDKLLPLILSHIWVLQKAESGMTFITSDAPVAYHWHRPMPIYGTGGLSACGIEIAIPLSSNYLLSLKERSHFAPYAAREGSVIPSPLHFMNFYNRLQVENARQFILAEVDDFSRPSISLVGVGGWVGISVSGSSVEH